MICPKCKEEVQGELKRPILRTKDGVENLYASSGYFSTSINTAVVGTTIDTNKVTITENLIIGQLPGGSIKAHIAIRDMFAVIGANGTVTSVIGFLHYVDVSRRVHTLAAFSDLQAINNDATLLIVDAPITDAQPDNIGYFALELVSLTLGTATRITAYIRANIEVQYEQ